MAIIRLIALTVPFLFAAAAASAEKIAVMPFELNDAQQEGEYVKKINPDETRRLKLVTEELRSLLAKDGRYEVLDLEPFAAAIEKAAPFARCDGCELPVAKEAGAEVTVTGFADKLSDALISLQLYVRDVSTGQIRRTMSAEIRGNTDELWLHGIRWLWRNRFNAPPPGATP